MSSTTTTRVLSLLGRKEQHQRREESIAKDNRDDERKDARKQRGTIDRSILRTLGYLHHLFCFDDDAKGTTNAQSTLEYLGYYYVKRKEKRTKEAVMNEGSSDERIVVCSNVLVLFVFVCVRSRRRSVGGCIKYTTHIYLRRPSSSSSSPVAIDGVGNVPQDAVRGRGEDGDD